MKFIKNNIVLFVLFVTSIILMVKNSLVPYYANVPEIIRIIFDKPKDNGNIALSELVDKFTSAYATSFIFYYIVNYKLEMARAKQVAKIIEPTLVSIYLYMSNIIAAVEFSSKIIGKSKEESMELLDKLNFNNDIVYCKNKSYINEKENGCIIYEYKLLNECNLHKSLIIKLCDELSILPSFLYCDNNIVDLISKIKISELLKSFPSGNMYNSDIYIEYRILNLGEKYHKFLNIHRDLANVVHTRYSCKFFAASSQEIADYCSYQEKIACEHPELLLVSNPLNNK